MDASHVWIASKPTKPLSKKYVGPYKVLCRSSKYFKIQIGRKEENVAIDRLKPAFIECEVADIIPETKEIIPRKIVSFNLD